MLMATVVMVLSVIYRPNNIKHDNHNTLAIQGSRIPWVPMRFQDPHYKDQIEHRIPTKYWFHNRNCNKFHNNQAAGYSKKMMSLKMMILKMRMKMSLKMMILKMRMRMKTTGSPGNLNLIR